MDNASKQTVARIAAVTIFMVFTAAIFAAMWSKTASGQTPKRRAISRTKYTEFQHSTKAHQTDCGSCHKFPSANWNKVRDAKTAFPDITDYPKHDSCIKCHAQQFFRGATPAICSTCHTAPGPRGGELHAYPNPREIYDRSPKSKGHESDFAVAFPHDKHIEIVSEMRRGPVRFANAAFSRLPAEESCAVCHQTMMPQGETPDEYMTKPPAKLGDGFWLKKGAFKTAPTGHTACFTCHSADTGILPAPANCAACHKLAPQQTPADFDPTLAKTIGVDSKVMLDAWKSRHSSGTYRHEWFSHAELSCATCHNVTAMDTSDPATTRVAMATCSSCHATKTADDGGALNYEVDSRRTDPKFQCSKCHVAFGKLPIPDSHTKALAAAK